MRVNMDSLTSLQTLSYSFSPSKAELNPAEAFKHHQEAPPCLIVCDIRRESSVYGRISIQGFSQHIVNQIFHQS